MENISNKSLIPIWFNDNEFALVGEEFLTEINKQIERLLTTKLGILSMYTIYKVKENLKL